MTRIQKRVTAEQKEAWKSFCKTQGVGESEMLGIILEKVTAGQVDTGFSETDEARSGQLSVRFHPKDFQRMTARAKADGFPSRTSWLNRLALTTLNKTPVLTELERNVLRESNRELSAIGRNLNQIARVLNIDFRESDKITKQAVEDLAGSIERHTEKVAALISKSLNRWGDDE